MGLSLAAVPNDTVDRLVADIDRQAYGCLPNYIPSSGLSAMRSFVSSAVRGSDGKYVGFTGADAVAGCSLNAVATSVEFRHLIKRVYGRGTGRSAPATDFYQVLRCLTGRTAKKHPLRFHHDSYVVTALIPVEVPTSGQTGDLVMLPNTRGIGGSYLANVLDKVPLGNAMTQVLLRTLMKLRLLPLIRIKPVPGNISFWGYRSIHTSEACDPDTVRATALFHDANPHAGKSLTPRLRRQPARA